ncbi:MAG: DegT/DnrJ/EryC1/StrS family aminotransferase [Thermoguttaceae bacterium]|nr:DegT/DnrJ/EryC1/StrS family aminotransferase [Thermoguttaceae bacterium]MDW8079037.1 DegT/DnrJ/EryC1/StrS family aminotransferase [Thermoguttaceae bacterium]
MEVPFFRPSITEAEIEEVIACLRSGWLTTGPRVRQFETAFAQAVGTQYAVAVNSCTAALHLAVEALGLRPGQVVLVPTYTFAATAEVVRYLGAIPLLVDCDPLTFNLDLNDAAAKLRHLREGKLPIDRRAEVVGIIPVHVAGLMLDMDEVDDFARQYGLWVVEDGAHAFPAAYWSIRLGRWRRAGQQTAAVTCFSFYANKTITTGEGGMAVTDNPNLANRIRQMSLHGLSQDAWGRYNGNGPWDYQILAPGYKYNLTDLAAAIGIHQLPRAEELRKRRESLAYRYREELAGLEAVELPPTAPDRVHAWHLFIIRINPGKSPLNRNELIAALRRSGVGCSVHWRPLHLHPYYRDKLGWQPEHLPVATAVWERVLSLPLYPDMTPEEQDFVISRLRSLLATQSSLRAAA